MAVFVALLSTALLFFFFFECAHLMSGVMLPFMCSYQSRRRPLIVLIDIRASELGGVI